jgi:hypothetical protein
MRTAYTDRSERRSTDRRRRKAFRLHERRSGFDRRQTPRAEWLRPYERLLRRLRDNALLLAALLIAINLLNLADFALTLVALGRGAEEANPVLRPMFDASPWAAAAFKLGLGFAVSLLVWDGRRYRKLLEVALLVLALYSLVILYHFWGLLYLS